ncbi:uncharacterized protein LOC130806643 isoform X2 [Amaranthus tricolor]|uniref:uncharacterized protein LOC130806643 isoform X2 n=1 Tax=Amaranthus tricolor TaxID=29722 RepID=UPI002587B270|nr:uncharacterized protein LOC130806643 isoform X2 [Amaranthus tricolor]
MNSEKKNAVKKEQKSPAPLPMYRPVVLRHVPTMVRRRYDHHLQSITLSTQDNSKNESEEAEAAEDPSAANSEMDDTETEHDILASLGTEHDTEEFGSSDFGSNTSLQLISEVDHETRKDTDVCSYQVLNEANDEVENKELGNLYNQGMHSEDGKSDGDGAEDDNLVHFVDDYLEDKIQDSGFAKFDDDQDGCRSKFGEAKDDVGSYVDANAQSEVMADEQDLELQYTSSENDHETEDADAFTYHEDGSNDDVESEDIVISDNQERTVIPAPNEAMNECPSPLPLLRHPIALKHVPTIVVRRYDPDLKYVLPINDYKTKGDEAHEDGKHAAAAIDLEDSINDVTLMEHDTLTNLDRKFDFGMYPEDSSNAEDDGIEGVNLASSVDTSIENRQDSGHVTYENSQGLVFEDLEHSESKNDEANEDSKTATAVNDVDVNVENGVKDRQSNDLDGFDFKDGKSQQNGAEENISGNQYARVNLKVVDKRLGNHCNEHEEFSPEAYKETLERDGYELCCPNCKCSITETMIFRRRQSSECPKTTCFSCLIPLFNWIRW